MPDLMHLGTSIANVFYSLSDWKDSALQYVIDGSLAQVGKVQQYITDTVKSGAAGVAGAGLAIGAVAAAIGYFLRTSENDEAIGNPLLDPDFVESVKQQVEGKRAENSL